MMSQFNIQILFPFLNSADKFPDRPSFCINRNFYSYLDFIKIISKIRDSLVTLGDSKIIGLVVNDDIETYASIMALWLEGHAYVPLHPFQPLARNLEIIDQASITIILDSSTISVYESHELIPTSKLNFSGINIEPKLVDENALAYILFTSGSTGKPKGVQINRKNIASFIASFGETGIIISENDKCLQCFDLTFDVSIQSFLIPLLNGACVYTVPHHEIKYSYVAELLDVNKITFGAMSPSLIRLLRPYFDEINLPSLRYNILTAEASPIDLIMEWAICIPNAEIYNFYGPTEATIYCSYNKFDRFNTNKSVNGMFSVGKLMEGVIGIVIDEYNNILTDGTQGELAISSNQITPGYWKNSEKDNEVFIIKEINGSINRFYKTGDSCYIDDKGDIMLYGRLDNQVKIQGYRIELGEIEYHARYILRGINTIAMLFVNSLGINEIVLFVESEDLSKSKVVSNYLKEKVPSYMVPTRIELVNSFPINTSGKVDRLKLKNIL